MQPPPGSAFPADVVPGQPPAEPDPIADLAADQPLPRRTSSGSAASTGVAAATETYGHQPVTAPHQHPTPSSVFESSAAAPALPTSPAATPTPAATPGQVQPVIQPAGGGLPTLPAPNPVAPPAVAEPAAEGPSTTDINALRSAQMRANKQHRQGKLFGRTLLVFVLVGIVIAAAVTFGRSYLFPTGWDAALTPIVDDVQLASGTDFDHAIPLVVQQPDAYASSLIESTLGSDWEANVAEWRALGLLEGDATVASVGATLSEQTAAFYDPAADTIYQAADRSEEELRPALEIALLEAFHHQLQPPVDGDAEADAEAEVNSFALTGVSAPTALSRSAADRYLVRRTAAELFDSTAEPAIPTDVPVPIAYELDALERLGAPILTATGLDPETLSLGAPYPDVIDFVFDDGPVTGPSPALRSDEQPRSEAVALGIDDWSLVWGARLPSFTVDQLVDIVTADNYQPTTRGGVSCFVATFRTATEADGTTLFSAMTLWAQRGPAESQALATQLAPTSVQLESCDPGVGAVVNVDPATGSELIERQINRFVG